MVGFAYRASIQTLSYELGTLQHHISARHAGYQTVFLTVLSPRRRGDLTTPVEAKLWSRSQA